MASLKDIRRRISAVRGTQKVTRAMKLVAAAKLRRAQTTAFDARAYTGGLYETTMRVSRRLGSSAPRLWRRPRTLGHIDLVVITSDRGLCGGFNEGLLSDLEEGLTLSAANGIGTTLFVVGKRGLRHLTAKGHAVLAVPAAGGNARTAEWLAGRLIARCRSGESDGATVCFNRFASAARQEITFWNLLPIYRRGAVRERHLEYLYEPAREEILDALCRESIQGTIRQALLESQAAELAARMAAMDNATRNAEEMIAHLTFVYNRARQEAITKELLDIVGGAEALK